MQHILVPVSPGELLDKISILRIKAARITHAGKLANVRHELELLEQIWRDACPAAMNLDADVAALAAVNARLWDIEDRVRERERAQCFDAEFVALARGVYLENDERAGIKKRINERLGSSLVEEKSYANER